MNPIDHWHCSEHGVVPADSLFTWTLSAWRSRQLRAAHGSPNRGLPIKHAQPATASDFLCPIPVKCHDCCLRPVYFNSLTPAIIATIYSGGRVQFPRLVITTRHTESNICRRPLQVAIRKTNLRSDDGYICLPVNNHCNQKPTFKPEYFPPFCFRSCTQASRAITGSVCLRTTPNLLVFHSGWDAAGQTWRPINGPFKPNDATNRLGSTFSDEH